MITHARIWFIAGLAIVFGVAHATSDGGILLLLAALFLGSWFSWDLVRSRRTAREAALEETLDPVEQGDLIVARMGRSPGDRFMNIMAIPGGLLGIMLAIYDPNRETLMLLPLCILFVVVGLLVVRDRYFV